MRAKEAYLLNCRYVHHMAGGAGLCPFPCEPLAGIQDSAATFFQGLLTAVLLVTVSPTAMPQTIFPRLFSIHMDLFLG